MAASRIETLKQMLQEQPDDPFLKYALAMEWLPTQPQEAGKMFKDLLENHADYLPTYFMAAQFYAEEEENKLAEDIYVQGIALAQQQNNLKTLAELKNAYQNWQFELD